MTAFAVARDCFPIYALYTLLFADSGLSTGEIGTLLILWSAVAFVLEIPSGAWADMVDRRLLLALGAVLQALAFAAWMVWPVYLGFALGFCLSSLASALQSGTFEALVYDELAARGRTERYARLIGIAQGVAMAVMTAAIAVAAPLYRWGGYPLVGWVSVGLAMLGVAAAVALPAARPAASVERDLPDGGARLGPSGPERSAVLEAEQVGTETHTATERRYLDTLRAGLREAVSTVAIRRVLLLQLLVVVLVAVDEYFPLLAAEVGVSTADVPWVIAGCSLAQAAGTAVVGWTATWRRAAFTALVLVAGALVGAGALLATPLALIAVGLGYGLANNAMVAADARLQHSITGHARATVTSVSGVGKEAAALISFGLVAVGSAASVATAIAIVALGATALAALAAWRADSVPR